MHNTTCDAHKKLCPLNSKLHSRSRRGHHWHMANSSNGCGPVRGTVDQRTEQHRPPKMVNLPHFRGPGAMSHSQLDHVPFQCLINTSGNAWPLALRLPCNAICNVNTEEFKQRKCREMWRPQISDLALVTGPENRVLGHKKTSFGRRHHVG